jgi:hypothetical protein
MHEHHDGPITPSTTRITNVEQLQEVLGHPRMEVAMKIGNVITPGMRALIAASPLVLVASSDANGDCDASLRGDPAGSVLVLNEKQLVLADRPGNKLGQTFYNVLENPNIGLNFLVPGYGATLRINGRAEIVSSAEFFPRLEHNGHLPKLATVVTAFAVYMHCQRAVRRSGVWDPSTWLSQEQVAELPSMGTVLKEQIAGMPMDSSEIDEALGQEATVFLYQEPPAPPQ